MTSFVITTPCDNPRLPLVRAAMARVFPGAFMEFADGQFVASHPHMTSIEASQLLDLQRGDIGQFAVFTIAGHHGWHRKDLWEWLQVRGTP